jgi:hypothetical protein
MREVLGVNGKNLGLEVGTLMVPNELVETALDILRLDLMIPSGTATDTATRNRHVNSVELVVAPELTDANDWFVIAKKAGLWIWVVMKRTDSPENRIIDKSSDKYKLTGKVALNSVWECNGGLGLPHGIHRYQG